MGISKGRSKKKLSGGLYKPYRKTKVCELLSYPILTKSGNTKLKKMRTRGGHTKIKMLRAEYVNVFDKKEGKHKKVMIKAVLENPANRHFVRKNIINKGAIVDTELGKARITSKPGQEGSLNAVLI